MNHDIDLFGDFLAKADIGVVWESSNQTILNKVKFVNIQFYMLNPDNTSNPLSIYAWGCDLNNLESRSGFTKPTDFLEDFTRAKILASLGF